MQKAIDDTIFTFLDTETTGLEPGSGDRVIEVAAVRLKGGERLAAFETLINPRRSLSEAASLVNGITADMLEGAPAMEEVAQQLLDFIGDSCLCSYNAPFDLGFLNSELRLVGRPPLEKQAVVDLLKAARRLIPGLERYSLSHVTSRLGLQIVQNHRAMPDVELTIALFGRLNAILKEKGITDFSTFVSLFGITPHYLDTIEHQKVAQIQQAIALGVRLKLRYLATSSAEVTERFVSPREVRKEGGKTYLIGHCHLRNDERAFRVDSILHLEME